MLSILSLTASVVLALPPATARTTGAQEGGGGELVDDAFLELSGQYQKALSHYQSMRLKAVSEGSRVVVPTHPARDFLPQFEAMAAAGRGPAVGWILQNIGVISDDPAEIRRQADQHVASVLTQFADQMWVIDAISGISSQAKKIGEDAAIEMCRAIAEKSTVPEIKARAMYGHAMIVSDGGRSKDPARLADSESIQQAILDTFPKTRVAQEIASDTFHGVEKQFFAEEMAWLEKVRAIQAAGRPPSEWPPNPIHQLARTVERVADVGFVEAQSWLNSVYAGYVQNETLGVAPALAFLVDALQQMYPAGHREWDKIRMGILEMLYLNYPSEPWVYPSLRKVIEKTRLVDAGLLEPALKPLLDKSTDPAVRPVALYTLARSLVDRGGPADIERAMSMYREVIDEYPESDLADPARRLLSRLVNVMPGGKFPYFAHKDAGGVDFTLDDYKGHVLMLEFFSVKQGDYTEPAAQRASLVTRMANRKFSMVGFNVDLITMQKWMSRSNELGINWRTVLLLSRQHLVKWEVNKLPTTILLDADGVVRGRDLPWAEMEALAERLVAEAEAKK